MRRFRSRVGWADPKLDPGASNGCTVLVGLVHSGKGFLGASHPGLDLFHLSWRCKLSDRQSSICKYPFAVMFTLVFAADQARSIIEGPLPCSARRTGG
jgi:hypothetical protein